jgi:hypothetical protein
MAPRGEDRDRPSSANGWQGWVTIIRDVYMTSQNHSNIAKLPPDKIKAMASISMSLSRW